MWGGGPGWAQSGVTDPATSDPGPLGPSRARVGARAVDLVVELAVGGAIALLLGLDDRPLAFVAAIWVLATAYETAAITMFGTTLGKRNSKLVVLPLDRSDAAVPLDQALPRAAAAAATWIGPIACVVVGMTNLQPVMFAVAIVWLAVTIPTTLGDPLARGGPDRVASTIVVAAGTEPPIRSRDLPGRAEAVRAPRISHLGRVPDVEVRTRARLRRLIGVAPLAVLLAILALAPALPIAEWISGLVAIAVWLVAFVVDETIRLRGDGTPGHRRAGLVVLDRRHGGAPSTGRAVARAVTLGLTLYIPLLWPALLVSLALMRGGTEGRGLHDLIAGTVVVADSSIDPAQQRRMAMRMRLGRVA